MGDKIFIPPNNPILMINTKLQYQLKNCVSFWPIFRISIVISPVFVESAKMITMLLGIKKMQIDPLKCVIWLINLDFSCVKRLCRAVHNGTYHVVWI